MSTIIQMRHDTAAKWTSVNPILALGEFGLETDTNKLKRGDGTTVWNSLSYYTSAPVTSVNSKTGDVELTASDVGALADNTFIPSDTSDLTNGAGFITGITSSDVTSALGYTPYNSSNPDNFQNASAVSSAIESNIINNVLSTSTTNSLSANMGKELQDQITHLQGIGRFLSLWDASTGLAETNPPVSPYTYKTGDYFIVGEVDTTTNYKPNGASYTTGVASSTVETETIDVGNVYYYDGTTWKLQAGGGGGTITDVLQNGTSVVTAGVASITVPTNYVTTDTIQTISGTKTFTGSPVFQANNYETLIIKRNSQSAGALITYSNNSGVLARMGINGLEVPIHIPSGGTPIRVLVRGGSQDNPTTGSTSQPVYIDADGIAQVASNVSVARTTVTDTTSTSITLANAVANTDYHYGTLTSLTVTANDTSDLETTIYFTAGATITVSLPATLEYIGSAPVFEPNTSYAISILNNVLVAGAVA